MPHDWQPPHAHDDREQVNKAREAADALFKPKGSVRPPEAPVAAPTAPSPIEQPPPRTPRIIAIPSTMPVTDATVAPPTDPKPGPRRTVSRRLAKVPASQHGRVRALAFYGMTLGEVADLYGVPVDVIERIVAAGIDGHSSAIE